MFSTRRGLLAATIAVAISTAATACLEVNGTGRAGVSTSAAAAPITPPRALNYLACRVMQRSGITDLVPASMKAHSMATTSHSNAFGTLRGTLCAYGISRSGFVMVAVYWDKNWSDPQSIDFTHLAESTSHGEGFYGTGVSALGTLKYNGDSAWRMLPIVQPTTGMTCTGMLFKEGDYGVDLEFAAPQQCAAVMNVADQASSYLVHLKSGN